MSRSMKRITVIGTAGAGKTTLARQLAEKLHYPFIELDALFWGPNRTPCPRDRFRERMVAALQPDCWAVGGNYGSARDLIWQRSDTLVWLDYPLPLTFWRLFRRTIIRIITGEELWAGNRESWRGQFLSRDSLLLYAIQTHSRHREEWAGAIASPELAHLQVLHFCSPGRTQQWLQNIDAVWRDMNEKYANKSNTSHSVRVWR